MPQPDRLADAPPASETIPLPSAAEGRSPWRSAEERRAYYAEAARAASPALQLQAVLGAEYEARGEERWKLRTTVGFVFAACGVFWAMVYFAVAAFIG